MPCRYCKSVFILTLFNHSVHVACGHSCRKLVYLMIFLLVLISKFFFFLFYYSVWCNIKFYARHASKIFTYHKQILTNSHIGEKHLLNIYCWGSFKWTYCFFPIILTNWFLSFIFFFSLDFENYHWTLQVYL